MSIFGGMPSGAALSQMSLTQVLSLTKAFGVKIENVVETSVKSECELDAALDHLEGACCRDSAETMMLTGTLNGKPTVIFFTTAPTLTVTKHDTIAQPSVTPVTESP